MKIGGTATHCTHIDVGLLNADSASQAYRRVRHLLGTAEEAVSINGDLIEISAVEVRGKPLEDVYD